MILVPVLPVLEARYVLMDLASAPAARKNATVPASALPNAAADALADKDAKTEPVHMFTMMFAPAVSSI